MKWPFEAIEIINLPKDQDKATTHRYGPNTFKLHRLPVPKQGRVLGLVGTTGIGKSTALRVLAGKLKLNLNPPGWQEILTYNQGSELESYFIGILEKKSRAVIKRQYVDHIPRVAQGNTVGDLSGRELQRFAIAIAAIEKSEIYMFDEPSSYLDVKQRLKAAQAAETPLGSAEEIIETYT
ncbi:ABC transporter ABCE [Parasponia andersonii]|uniref:ABC transporter ABCE n=1 Tax=Parasponia andersonii TaxID=3476 RepID=A0A2P5ALQ1_PARAD|nr:ABC transporter ABCE [Parasponia andersonii]